MRDGRHYAQFTVVEGDDYDKMFFGVIRPGWDVEGGMSAQLYTGHCFYHTRRGTRWPGRHKWEGRQGAYEDDDRICSSTSTRVA